MDPVMRLTPGTLAARCIGIVAISVGIQLAGTHALAVDQAALQQSISRGVGHLQGEVAQAGPGERSLFAVALYKGGVAVNSPEISGAVQQVRNKIAEGVYTPMAHHLYEAGVDAMLLADVGGEPEEGAVHPYQAELQAISNYLVGQQLSNGGWDYPAGAGRDTFSGDTSVIQYALLGLWAAERAGVTVAPTVWQRAIEWHIANQNSDGGFAYVPGTDHGFGHGASVLNMTVNAIGSTYIALMYLSPGNLPQLVDPRIERAEQPEEADRTRFGGVLEQVDLGNVDEQAAEPVRGEIPAGTEDLLSRAYGWLSGRFTADNSATGFRAYYYYSLERMGALANVELIGDARWFDECADWLIREQQSNGGWKLSSHNSEPVDTAFCVLFLTRSTAKILKRTIPVDPIGGGLLAGGRGDLDSATGTQKKDLGPLDQLLAALENPTDVDLEEVQEQIVEKVQIGDRNALVGQKDLLARYVKHPNAEVRRTAVWALGRSDDLSLARLLIEALDDVDLAVMIEARNALCWLARKPNGLGEADDPLQNMPPDATEEQQKAAIGAWHSELVRKWGTWYLQNRPYADRGDEFEAQLLQKIAAAAG
jgi:hypothetical protein